jgi:hypothetical protein
MSIGGSPETAQVDLVESSEASKRRVGAVDISASRIEGLLESAREALVSTISSDAFLDEFPGERLLFGFAGEFGISGEIFRNSCLDHAQQMRFRPEGLERTLLEVLED